MKLQPMYIWIEKKGIILNVYGTKIANDYFNNINKIECRRSSGSIQWENK